MSAKVIQEEVVRALCDECMYYGEWTYEDSEAQADADQHNLTCRFTSGDTP
jgi:hypothetical protein